MIFEIDGYNALRNALKKMCIALENDKIPDGAVFKCKLVADELVSNVLQHGEGSAFFSFERCGEVVKISVRGSNEFRPPEVSACADVESESGRGLFLVDAVCETRRYSREEGVCVVIRVSDVL